MASNRRLTLDPRTVENAEPRAAELLEQAKRKNGRVPNMYAAMANAPGVLDTYLHGYDLFRKNSGFTPVEQEVIFLTISRENGCEYCMAAHSTIADNVSRVPREVTDAIRADQPISEPKLNALATFAPCFRRAADPPNRTSPISSEPVTQSGRFSKLCSRWP